VFVLCRQFQPTTMFVGEARSEAKVCVLGTPFKPCKMFVVKALV
jgi:hypothetical protein